MALANGKQNEAPGSELFLTWLCGAALIGLANAAHLFGSISRELRTATRCWIHFYDLSFFLALGLAGAALAFGVRILQPRIAALRSVWGQILLAVATGGVGGAAILGKDLANFASNHPLWLNASGLAAIAGALALPPLLGVQRWLQAQPKRWHVGLVIGAFLAWVNGRILVGDYPGIHLSIGIAALLVLAGALPSFVRRAIAVSARSTIIVIALGMVLFVFVRAPTRSVRQNLGVVAGSCVFPFVAPLITHRTSGSAIRLAAEGTPFFRDRSQMAPIAPTPGANLPGGAALVFLTVDALRVDVVESRKHDAQLPNLARIRDAACRFTMARTPSPSTLTTVSSILSGKYYSQLYFTTQSSGKVLPISDTSSRVPELLSAAGVRTVHVLALHGLGADAGVGRGFSEEYKTPKDYGRASHVMDLVLAQLGRLASEPSQRFFLYSHFVDSHAPYTLGGKRATEFESYLAELELVDHQLGRLLERLDQPDLKGRYLVVIAADHGEAFGEHGHHYHARSVYDELLRVPLMFYSPRYAPNAQSVPVTLLDMSSTLLDLFGLATPGDYMGQSLVPLLLGNSVKFQRPIAADSGRRKQALIFDDGIKVHLDLPRATVEVFDILRDPAELHDLTDDPARDVEPYVAATERFFEAHTLKIANWRPPWRSF